MNKRGEVTVGLMLAVFIGIIVALVLYQATFGFIGIATQTQSSYNRTITAPAANAYLDLVGQEILGTPYATNNSAIIDTTNYTVTESISSVDGLKRIRFQTVDPKWAGRLVNVSIGTYGPEGYIEDAGGRSIALLIAILAVVGIIMFTLIPTLREKFF